jgi:hypothetical protein
VSVLVGLAAHATAARAAQPEMDKAGESVARKMWTFSTDDTVIRIAVYSNKQYIVSLENPSTRSNWTPNPSEVPLLNRVSMGGAAYTPDWTYQDATVEHADGYKVTLRFTSSTPNLELKSYWQAQKGCGPVENWMTVENRTGQTITYKYQDVISSCLTVSADATVNLWRFFREPIGRNNGGLDVIALSPNSRIVSVVSDGFNQRDPERLLPFVVMDAGQTHGLYIGYGWDFGRFVNSTGSDPRIIVTKFDLGDAGEISEEDGKVLRIPYTFYGTYTGDVDDGCNKMKKWFWNYNIPRSLRDNANEPLVELHAPFYDEAGWSAYLNTHPLKSWGVDLVKMDIAWMIPGPFADWPNEVGANKRTWTPDPAKWPKGMTFGTLAHSNNLKASLYMFDTYQNADLATVQGRIAEKQALLERFDKGWYDYWRSDFDLEGEFDYLKHQGFLDVVDFMIAKRPGFRWENCSGGGQKKSFDMAERMTFMTTEDNAQAITYRWAFYGNSYVLNPVQLKADIAVDWNSVPSLAWDKYNFRTGLLGAIMVCGSEKALDAQQERVARETWSLYQTRQRAILREGDVYHILPFPDGVNWDGMQFYNTGLKRGSVLLFKPSATAPDSMIIKLKGLNRRVTYTLAFQDRTNENCSITGAQLMNHGIQVAGMSGAYASEIVWMAAGQPK